MLKRTRGQKKWRFAWSLDRADIAWLGSKSSFISWSKLKITWLGKRYDMQTKCVLLAFKTNTFLILFSAVGVGAIPVWTWLPVLCCAMIWILLYRGYRYIFMDFIGWTDKDFFSAVITASPEREREMPRLIGYKSDSEPDSFCSKHTIGFFRTAHKLDYNNFPNCNLCGNITKSVNGR